MIKIKIGIVSDVHLAYTSSIMPLHENNSKYTTRLQMCIDSINWSEKLFEEKNVDYIFNLGDLCDNTVLRAEEISALSELYKNRDKNSIKEYYVLGNHEALDNTHKFHSTSFLTNIPNMELISRPQIIELKKDNEILKVTALPHIDHTKITNEFLKSINSEILFSHIDIKGSSIRQNYCADFGIDPDMLCMYFNQGFNGHIHTQEELKCAKKNFWNVGSLTSTSFSDSKYYIPSAHIYDTQTRKFESFQNPYVILFRDIKANTLVDLKNGIKKIVDNQFKYILKVTIPYNLRNDSQEIISKFSNIIAYRIVSDLSRDNKDLNTQLDNSEIKLDIIDKENIKSEFLTFIKDYEKHEKEILRFPYEKYIEVISKLDYNQREEVKNEFKI